MAKSLQELIKGKLRRSKGISLKEGIYASLRDRPLNRRQTSAASQLGVDAVGMSHCCGGH